MIHNYFNYKQGRVTPEYKYLLPRDFEFDVEPYVAGDGKVNFVSTLKGFWNETEHQLRLAGKL